ncbi:MAG: CHASE2 domain-containing protein [Myxococcales bacterium]|nr:CHASE2 domain-containing protein [Myxococcales bacterium]
MRSSFLVKPFFVAILVTVLLIVAKFIVGSAYLDEYEQGQLRQQFRGRTQAPMRFPKDVVLVEINEANTEASLRWPWDPGKVAALIKTLREAKAKVIALAVPLVSMSRATYQKSLKTALVELNKNFPPLPKLDPAAIKSMNRRKRAAFLRKYEKMKAEDVKVQALRKKLDELTKKDGYEELIKEVKATKNLVIGYYYYPTEEKIPGIEAPYLKLKQQTIRERKLDKKGKKGAKKDDGVVELYHLAPPVFVNGATVEPAVDAAALREQGDLAKHLRYHGFLNLTETPDKALYQVPLFAKNEGKVYPSLAVAAYIAANPNDPPQRLVGPNGYMGLEVKVGGGKKLLPLDRDGNYRINYYGPVQSIPREQRALASTIAVTKGFSDGFFDGKVAFIGLNHPQKGIRIQTPFKRSFSEVEIQAMLFANMVQGKPLVRGSAMVEIAGLLVMGLLLGFLLSLVRYVLGFFVTVGLSGVLIFLDRFYLFPDNAWYQWGYTIVGLFVIYIVVSLTRRFTSDRERNLMLGRFRERIHQDDLSKILKDPNLLPAKGSWRPVAFLSAYAHPIGETLTEEKNAARISEMFAHLVNPMGDAIRLSRGLVTQLSSHNCQGLFNAPLPLGNFEEQAAQASLQIRFAWDDFVHKYWQAEGLPEPHFGIGLDSGAAVIGNFGGEGNYTFTAVGKPVTYSEILQDLTHTYKSQILVSENIYEKLQASGQFVLRELDWVQFDEEHPNLTVYELLGKAPAASPLPEAVEWYQQGLSYYRSRNFQEAQRYFEELLQRRPDDGPAAVMLGRCKQFTSYPPNFNWDGTWKLKA